MQMVICLSDSTVEVIPRQGRVLKQASRLGSHDRGYRLLIHLNPYDTIHNSHGLDRTHADKALQVEMMKSRKDTYYLEELGLKC